MFLARCNNFFLESNYAKWKNEQSDGKCKFCQMDVLDTLKHRFFSCSNFSKERKDFLNCIKDACSDDVFAGFIRAANFDEKLGYLLGDVVLFMWGHEQFTNFDRCTKLFLAQVFKPR